MSVEMLVRDNVLRIFPFAFDIDRYRLGITGYNDLALNFDYHISVLKSPLPFKFGINIKGNPDKYKFRLGGAKYKDSNAVRGCGHYRYGEDKSAPPDRKCVSPRREGLAFFTTQRKYSRLSPVCDR